MLLERFLDRIIDKNEVALAVEGAPGFGKTQIIEGWAKKKKIPLIKILASTLDSSDVAGVIVANHDKKTAEYYNLGLLEQATKGRTLIYLDEFSTAIREVQDALLTIIESRVLPDGTPLHPDTMIVMSHNPTLMVNSYEMSPAMRNRFAWIHWSQTAKEWWESYGVEVPADAQIREMMDILINDDGLEFTDDKGFAEAVNTFTTPRSLTRLLQFAKNVDEVKAFAPSFVGKEAVELIDAYQQLDDDIRGNAFFTRAKAKVSDANKKSDISGVKMTSLHSRVSQRLEDRGSTF